MRLIRRPLVALLTLVLATGAGIATASELVVGGDPPDRQPRELVPGPGAPRPGPSAPDPDGGPPWAVRTYVSEAWYLCAEAGRRVDGVFGDLDEHGKLAERPTGPTGACGDPHADALVASVRQLVGPPERTVVYGASGRDPLEVTLDVAGEKPRALPVGSRGSFIAVLAGLQAPADMRLEAKLGDGTTTSLDLGG